MDDDSSNPGFGFAGVFLSATSPLRSFLLSRASLPHCVSFDRKAANRLPFPARLTLSQNHPNPFDSTTESRYQVPESTDVTLIFYDLLEREVAMLVNGWKIAGGYTVLFDGSLLLSGVVSSRLHADNDIRTKKLALLMSAAATLTVRRPFLVDQPPCES